MIFILRKLINSTSLKSVDDYDYDIDADSNDEVYDLISNLCPGFRYDILQEEK